MKKTRCIAIMLVCAVLCSTFAGAIESIDINSAASILIDATDGHEIYGENADEQRAPASITKLMTALLVIENVPDLNVVITANESAFEGLSSNGSTVGIKIGEEMTVDNLLVCMLVASANEAANILAEYVGGSIPGFVELMNKRAKELEMTNTNFANPNGLDDVNNNHYTTARDIAKLAMEVRKHERLREICAMEDATIPATNLKKERYFFTTNSLISKYKELGYKYSYANGLKTGSTSAAGLCLVATAEKGEKQLISVVLGATKDEETGKKGNFVESKRLLEWGFENFEYATLISPTDAVCEVRVESAKDRDHVIVHVPESFSVMMPKDFDANKVELIPSVPEVKEAPIKKGEELGTVLVRYEGRDYITLPLIASDDLERSELEYTAKRVKAFMKSPIAIISMIAIAVIILCLIIYVIYYNKKRKRRQARRRYYR